MSMLRRRPGDRMWTWGLTPCLLVLVWLVGGCGGGTTVSAATSTSLAVAAPSSAPGYTILTTAPVRAGASGTSGSSAPDDSTPASDSTNPTNSPTTGPQSTTTTAPPQAGSTSSTTAKVVVLRINGPTGTVGLSMDELKALPATAGYGGWKNVLDNITQPRQYRGVSLSELTGLVGGGTSVTIVASDGYEQELTPDELSGVVGTFDPATGAQSDSYSGAITPVLAYELKGGALSQQEGGPLRIVFLSPSADQVTDSKLWVKFVSVINVR